MDIKQLNNFNLLLVKPLNNFKLYIITKMKFIAISVDTPVTLFAGSRQVLFGHSSLMCKLIEHESNHEN